ncbi:MAG: TdeIII family type II restriction endonuclease, partial [bacterium]|nr:TdeIII family type II restriction endonuclease [bacterium]
RRDNYEDYIDITSVKPNIKEFAVLKRKLLRWTALRLSQDRTADVITRLALPYNPYYPNTYDRWTLKGLYDLDFGEILIAEDFWNYTADCDVYEDLLDIFQQVGDEIRPELDRKFAEFK